MYHSISTASGQMDDCLLSLMFKFLKLCPFFNLSNCPTFNVSGEFLNALALGTQGFYKSKDMSVFSTILSEMDFKLSLACSSLGDRS